MFYGPRGVDEAPKKSIIIW